MDDLDDSYSHLPEGRVIASTGAWYAVDVDGTQIQARIRGRFRQQETGTTNPVAVGDRVRVSMEDDGTGVIEHIAPRVNQFSRRAAGRRVGMEAIIAVNVDFVWVVQSAQMPGLNPGLVDRFLVTAARDEIPAGIIVNKIDLLDDFEDDEVPVEAFAWFEDLYTGLGYPVLTTSAETGEGLDALRDVLDDVVIPFNGVVLTSRLVDASRGMMHGGVRAADVLWVLAASAIITASWTQTSVNGARTASGCGSMGRRQRRAGVTGHRPPRKCAAQWSAG